MARVYTLDLTHTPLYYSLSQTLIVGFKERPASVQFFLNHTDPSMSDYQRPGAWGGSYAPGDNMDGDEYITTVSRIKFNLTRNLGGNYTCGKRVNRE